MRLIVIHYHWRRGGVRRLIEAGLPALCAALQPELQSVIMAAGEAPDPSWRKLMRDRLDRVALSWRRTASFSYSAQQNRSAAALRRAVRSAVSRLLRDSSRGATVVWAHNLSLGRNFPLAAELAGHATAGRIRLLLHHHDFWFDQRSDRWSELRTAGATESDVAAVFFPADRNAVHIVLSRAVLSSFRPAFAQRAAWIPNPLPAPPVSRWPSGELSKMSGADDPLWLMPTRILRRKNVAEALLLTRWLRPEAWLATTASASSPNETAYAQRLEAAAKDLGWKLRLGVLRQSEATDASAAVGALIASAEAILCTSVQEGFGLGILEATAAHRPVLWRRLGAMAGDFARMGLVFPQTYVEIEVDLRLFDWPGERRRQQDLFENWRESLPPAARGSVQSPTWWSCQTSVPFSRLTLSGQLQVLEQPTRKSWSLCAALNPQLVQWKRLARLKQLSASRWTESAARSLNPRMFAARMVKLLAAPKDPPLPKPTASVSVQGSLMRRAGRAENLFPLLWSRDA